MKQIDTSLMKTALTPLAPGRVKLLPGMLQQRRDLNRRYVASLKNENLL